VISAVTIGVSLLSKGKGRAPSTVQVASRDDRLFLSGAGRWRFSLEKCGSHTICIAKKLRFYSLALQQFL
jgi:hypothetical protein